MGWLELCRGKRGRVRMSAEEQLHLSFWRKWMKYGRVPWKFILHLCIVAATTAQVCLLTQQRTHYARSSQETWFHTFFPEGFTFQDRINQGAEFYTIDETIENMRRSVRKYWELPDTSVDRYVYIIDEATGLPELPWMQVKRYKQPSTIYDPHAKYNRDTITRDYRIENDTALGPIDDGEVTRRVFFDGLYTMKLTFRLDNVDLGPFAIVHYRWTVSTEYNFAVRGGNIHLELHMSKSLVDGTGKSLADPFGGFLWLNFVIIFLALLSQIMSIRALAKSFALYQKTRRSIGFVSWSTISFYDKMRFVNVWFYVMALGSICNLVASILNLTNDTGETDAPLPAALFTGLGCLFAWVNMVRYLEYSDKYYTLIHTLKRGMPNVGRFLVGAFPIFFGYALFGVAFFSDYSDKFSNLDKSSVTLFSLLNGDIIMETFQDIYAADGFISRFYLYTFICLFIYAVLNIFISIIEEAYYMAKGLEGRGKQKREQLQQAEGDQDLNFDEGVFDEIVRRTRRRAAAVHMGESEPCSESHSWEDKLQDLTAAGVEASVEPPPVNSTVSQEDVAGIVRDAQERFMQDLHRHTRAFLLRQMVSGPQTDGFSAERPWLSGSGSCSPRE